ncbi:MAG: MgtC/SapB family protein [Candidatus Aenigmarchaeota archaeon]|nr:MgtC/SapB family protein [Candidatus Aenigmarchaeota archaeon]
MALTISPFETEIIIKLTLATVLGVLIGIEREMRFSPAGMKTHPMVVLGAALFTVLASHINTVIASGIITGVGFLGAGAIFRTEERVRGLTSAALIWVSAAIGMAIGFGLYVAAVTGTVFVFIVLVVFGYIEKKYVEKMAKEGVKLGKTTKMIEKMISGYLS